ncbi:hypothetical protein [Actinoplanes sp. NPDC026670]|uniref:hypothetical protein n=1 Tax=Actinoplanes sp. NPDC026670 TaxID=3154700 RepID=UPI0033F4F418
MTTMLHTDDIETGYPVVTGLGQRLKDAETALADLLGPGTPVYLCTWGEKGTADTVRAGNGAYVDGRTEGAQRALFLVRPAAGEVEVEVSLPGGAGTVWLTESAARQLGSALLSAARTPGHPVTIGGRR